MFLSNASPFSLLQTLTPFEKFSLALRVMVVILYILVTITHYHLILTQTLPSSAAYQTIKYIAYNLATPPITSISLVPASDPCPESSSRITLASWMSASDACFSSSAGSKPEYAPHGPPNKDDHNFIPNFDRHCFQILETMRIWKSHKFCAQRLVNYIYIDRSITCPEGFIRCSQGFCVSQDELCPITNIRFISSSQDQAENGGNIELEVLRDPEEEPIYDLEVLPQAYLCYEVAPILSEQDLGITHECNKYGEDKGTTILDQQSTSVFVQENNVKVRNTSLIDATEDLPSFLMARRNVIKERDSMAVLDLDDFQNKFNKLGSLSTIMIAFMNTQVLIFIMLFCLKHQIISNLLLLYCIVQILTGIYMFILVCSFNNIQDSNVYIFFSSTLTFSSENLGLALSELKGSLDSAITALIPLSICIILFAIMKLTVFSLYLKLQKRWINQPGSGVIVLEVSPSQEGTGLLLGLFPGVGEAMDRSQRSTGDTETRGRRQRQRGQDIEMETMSS